MTIFFRTLLICCLLFASFWVVTIVASVADERPQKELFSFGVIADIQYGDKENSNTRHYRKTLEKLKESVVELNEQKLAFTIQLGDIIDGNDTPEKSLSDLKIVLAEYTKLSMPHYHVVGNHCLNANKDVLHRELKLGQFYYAFYFPAAKGWRFIVLDGNDEGYGIIGKEQQEWLKLQLEESYRNSEHVIVFNHYAFLESAAKRHRMKTPEPVLELINNSGCVVAYIAGHDHAGGYAFLNGIHHITINGMIEAPIKNAYAVIKVFPNKLEKVGYGKEPSVQLVF
jgi:manganese-dependent ADP-ribose/CDP-alcohol diphosphatase